jgi:chaperonin GroEL
MNIQMFKNNIYNTNALTGIANGVDIATSVVKQTLGGAGRNVIIEKDLPPYHILTNDGASIIEAMVMEDPLEKRGLGFLQEVVARSNANSGDGSTTTCVLVDAILKEGIKTGINTLEIKKSLDETLPIIEQLIDEQTKPIHEKDISSVALIAGESEEIAYILQQIYFTIGKEGVIYLDNSGTYQTTYELIEGVRFTDTGYLSPYMVYEEEKRKRGEKENKAVYENPTILVTKKKIAHLNDINPLLEALTKQGKKDLVIFTDDMDSGVASILVKAHRERVINCLIIKAPILWKNYVFEDFAKITGSTIIEDTSGINSFKNLPLSVLGTCARIEVSREETTIIPNVDFSDHIKTLKQDRSDDSLRRLSWLQTKTAILKLGANSETELSWKRLKAEDAINSCQKALQSGVVEGGGVCLLKVARNLGDSIGEKIMKSVLIAPIAQIMINAGVKENPVGVVMIGQGVFGFNAKTGKRVENMLEEGIVDAAKIVKQAVRNAIGISSTILTCSAVITLPPKSRDQIVAEQLKGKTSIF